MEMKIAGKKIPNICFIPELIYHISCISVREYSILHFVHLQLVVSNEIDVWKDVSFVFIEVIFFI